MMHFETANGEQVHFYASMLESTKENIFKENPKISHPKTSGEDKMDTNSQKRVHCLEKNLSMLKEQHAAMLADLHNEIETIKNKNRELQFQLLLGTSPHPPATSEQPDRVAQITEISPVEAEILGNEIKELQSTLHEARSRNVYLANLIEKQQAKLQQMEKAAEEDVQAKTTIVEKDRQAIETSAPEVSTELFKKLQRTENLVNHLKNENKNQREELAELRLSLDQDSRKYRGCNHPAKRQLGNSGDGKQRSSSLVRMSPQKTGKLPLLKSRISRQQSVQSKSTGSPPLPRVNQEEPVQQNSTSMPGKREKSYRRVTVRGESLDSKSSRA
eukprot:TRINITY_DN8550_c0_g1_i1.p1 TRINITY_DN8550_c0_g1~~TRINITY_DN8550_c0_g1_i1.p1  ORF type:complete len:330 (-),score=83.00 TRINITY_DN8550_c0_g1_i1:147-1136(-)